MMLPRHISRSTRAPDLSVLLGTFSRLIPQYLNSGPHFMKSAGLKRVGAGGLCQLNMDWRRPETKLTLLIVFTIKSLSLSWPCRVSLALILLPPSLVCVWLRKVTILEIQEVSGQATDGSLLPLVKPLRW